MAYRRNRLRRKMAMGCGFRNGPCLSGPAPSGSLARHLPRKRGRKILKIRSFRLGYMIVEEIGAVVLGADPLLEALVDAAIGPLSCPRLVERTRVFHRKF